MSDDLDIFDMDRVEQDDLLNELDSLRGLLDEEATASPRAAATGSGDDEAGAQDEVPELEMLELESEPADEERAAAPDPDDDAVIPELGEELVVPEPAAETPTEPTAAAEAPTQAAPGDDPADDGEIPVLSDVVFSGTEVPDEAVALMSALNAGAEPAEAPEETAGETLPTVQELETMVDEIVERELALLRGELRERILGEMRAQLGLDVPPSED